MYGKRWISLGACLVLCLLGLVPAAHAGPGGWPWPVTGAVTLPYGASYLTPTGARNTHGGLDIAASAGETVRCSVAGTVVFAGLVPAGEGARAWAVTVAAADGLRVTYLPFSTVRVSKGADVVSGSALGTLAEGGDASGAATHLHLGVKRGSASLDPAAFLGEAVAAQPAPIAAPPAPARDAPAAGAGGRAGAVVPMPSADPVGAQAPSAVPAGAQAPAAVLEDALSSLVPVRGPDRIESVAEPAAFNLARARADLERWRDEGLSWAMRMAALGVAAGCAWPVMRAMRRADRSAAPVAVRSQRR